MMKSILSILSDESLCAYLLRIVRWSNGIYCYHNHTFNDKSNTIFHYKHIRLSDYFKVYDRLEEYGFNNYGINHSNKEYAKDNIHINNCENKANLLKIWLSKFMGINKYNLNLYVKIFQFIHNIRSLNSFDKFMKILSLVIISLATGFGIMSVFYFYININACI